jgi:toxin FitB
VDHLEIMPESRRRAMLSEDFQLLLQEDLEGRVINFDSEAAHATAALIASRRGAGRTGELRDSMIAGIAIAAGAALATRNTRHCDDLPITVINPWTA